VSSKVIVIHALEQRSLKNMILKWDEILNLHGEPTCLGWTVRELGDKTTCNFRDTLSSFGER